MHKLNRILVIVLGTLFLTWLFVMIPFLRIKTVSFSDTHYLHKEQLTPLFSPLKGKHMLALMVSNSFFSAIQLQYPFIDRIETAFEFPSHLKIQLVEKKPFYTFVTEESSFFTSKEGIVLNRYIENVHTDNISSLVIVKGIPKSHFNQLKVSSDIMNQLDAIVRNMLLYFPNQSLQVEFGSPFDLTIYMNDQIEIKLGTMAYLDIKFTHLNQFLVYYKGELSALNYIDLRVEDRIVVGMEEI